MKAVRIVRPGGPEVLQPAEVETPEPGPGAVLVGVRCTGLNRADLLQRAGRYPAPEDVRSDIPGLEYSGVVVRVGEGVDRALDGTRVMGLVPGGAYAEYLVAPRDQILPIPDRLDFEQAAAVPEAFLTAWDALGQSGFGAGMTVLIHAAGSGVGTAALQLARLAGASQIFGTASRGKLDAIARHRLPLDVAVDYRQTRFREVVERETAGRGVDVILDLVGASYWADDLACLAERGRLVLIGLLSGARAETDLGTILRNRLNIIGTVMRTRGADEKRRLARSFSADILPHFADGTLAPVLDRVFPLAEAGEAHAFMEANRNFGKIVLRVG